VRGHEKRAPYTNVNTTVFSPSRAGR